MPPIVVAAIAHGSTDNAVQLKQWFDDVITHLAANKLYPITYATDGTETERPCGRLVVDQAKDKLVFTIAPDIPAIKFDLTTPLINGHPVVYVQDSKHALKTARNQTLTGARGLVMGTHMIHYGLVAAPATNEDGPLMLRDVIKLDRQDDAAACRLFSDSALEYASSKPDYEALTLYLFMMSGLVNAWQSRYLSHRERAKMVLRSRFFLARWKKFITTHPDYASHKQFISRESFDIFMILCDSFLSLVRLYRDHFSSYPFLPWSHSTETVEHIFGIFRQHNKDFNYAEVLRLIPKLAMILLNAHRSSMNNIPKDNNSASGYSHIYNNGRGIDYSALQEWPSDEEIQRYAVEGDAEAAQCLEVLGIYDELLRPYECVIQEDDDVADDVDEEFLVDENDVHP